MTIPPSRLRRATSLYTREAFEDGARSSSAAKAYAVSPSVYIIPQNQQIRKLQHELVEQHNLISKSVGEGENRHLRIVGGKDFEKKIV